MAVAFFTKDEIVDTLRAELAELLNRADAFTFPDPADPEAPADADEEATVKLLKGIDSANAIIESHVKARYTLPANAGEVAAWEGREALRMPFEGLLLYLLTSRHRRDKLSEVETDGYKRAMDYLDKIQKGQVVLQKPGEHKTFEQTTTSTFEFDRPEANRCVMREF